MNQRTEDKDWRSMLVSRHEAKFLGRETEWLRPPPAATGATPMTDALLLEINEGRVYKDESPLANLARHLELQRDDARRELAALQAIHRDRLAELNAFHAALAASSTGAPVDAPTVAEIEEFRREHLISGHPDGGADLEPWAIQENRVLNYLCYRACTPLYAAPQSAVGAPKRTEAEVINDCLNVIAKYREALAQTGQWTAETVANECHYRLRQMLAKITPLSAPESAATDDAGSKG